MESQYHGTQTTVSHYGFLLMHKFTRHFFTVPVETSMIIVHPVTRDELLSFLTLAKEISATGVVSATTTKTKSWRLIRLTKCTIRPQH